jgi:hypothetical protein
VFEFTVTGIDRVQQRIDSMQQKIEALDNKGIPDEFMRWQQDDMKRSFPKIEGAGFTSYFTMIYPRSRRPKRQRKRMTFKSGARRRPRFIRGLSNRPILRPELFDMLCKRMQLLLQQSTW